MDYISYSQYNSYTRCPRNWYLSYIRKAEQLQTWYLPIGTAVHSMIEAHLASPGGSAKPHKIEAADFFYPLISAQMEIEPDTSKWLAGGPKDRPVVGELALQKVTECFERAVQALDDIEVWEVEYDASGRLPGLEVPIKAYVDVIGEHKKKGPVILDWKTGSTKPGNFQLETYAALMMEVGYGHGGNMIGRWSGRYVMLRPGSSETRYVDLSEVDPAEVGEKYQAVYERMQKKIYTANAGFDCRFCFNQENCAANKGFNERTMYYDRSSEDGFVF